MFPRRLIPASVSSLQAVLPPQKVTGMLVVTETLWEAAARAWGPEGTWPGPAAPPSGQRQRRQLAAGRPGRPGQARPGQVSLPDDSSAVEGRLGHPLGKLKYRDQDCKGSVWREAMRVQRLFTADLPDGTVGGRAGDHCDQGMTPYSAFYSSYSVSLRCGGVGAAPSTGPSCSSPTASLRLQ